MAETPTLPPEFAVNWLRDMRRELETYLRYETRREYRDVLDAKIAAIDTATVALAAPAQTGDALRARRWKAAAKEHRTEAAIWGEQLDNLYAAFVEAGVDLIADEHPRRFRTPAELVAAARARASSPVEPPACNLCGKADKVTTMDTAPGWHCVRCCRPADAPLRSPAEPRSEERARLIRAVADAIRRPLGVVPDSAMEWYPEFRQPLPGEPRTEGDSHGEQRNVYWHRGNAVEIHTALDPNDGKHPWSTACGLTWAGKGALYTISEPTCADCRTKLRAPASGDTTTEGER